jgi:glycerol-3-phosphate dehydrogenase
VADIALPIWQRGGRVLAYPDAGVRIHPDGPDVWGQVRYAAEHEWALTPEDVTRRRTTLDVRGLSTATICERIATFLAAPLH